MKKLKFISSIIISSIFILFVCANPVFAEDSNGNYDFVKTDVSLNKIWTIHFNKALKSETVNENNISLADCKGTSVKIKISLGNDGKSVIVQPEGENYISGQTYYLKINKNVTSEDNKNLTKDCSMKFSMILDQLQPPEKDEEIGVITTNMGTIKVKFFPQYAPLAVKNFKTHAQNGYYNNLIFHRVMNNFMIQGGDPKGNGTGGESIWEKPFQDEFSYALHNFRGALSMANSGPDTNGSQFFIVQAPKVSDDFVRLMNDADKTAFSESVVSSYEKIGGTPWLDYVHTVFGQVFEGMDVVDSIAAVKVDAKDHPLTDVVIEKVEIVKY